MTVLDGIARLSTDPVFLREMQSASKRLSAAEVHEQRISFAYGLLDRNSTVTKEQVRQAAVNQGSGPVMK